MKPMAYPDQTCSRVLDRLDYYMDGELVAGEKIEIADHLATCDECRSELETKIAVRDRVRTAARTLTVSADLGHRILEDVRSTPRTRSRQANWAMSLAAGIALAAFGGAIAYQLGHLRLTVASQDSYIATITQRVGRMMSVGLRDHVHCAVFRKYPTQAPSPEQIASDMGPQFSGLVDIVRKEAPPEQRIVMAHRCGYRGRKFVHIALADGTHLSSLVIAVREPGENLDTSRLTPALSDGGLPIYRTSVHRFQIDGFQSGPYLVYLVSDLSADTNLSMLAKLAPSVRDFLANIQS